MQALACRTSALAVTMLFASCVSAVAQDYAGREKLRVQSNEFRKEVIRVTDGVYVAVGYSASNVIPTPHRAVRPDDGDLAAHPRTVAGACRDVHGPRIRRWCSCSAHETVLPTSRPDKRRSVYVEHPGCSTRCR
jgi:hypothetical protein